MSKTALILAHRFLPSSPRALKEIAWLQEKNWTVDSAGIGSAPPITGHHYPIRLPPFFLRVAFYLVPNMRLRFHLLYGQYFPKELSAGLWRYDLIIVHEPTFLPLPSLRTEVFRRWGAGVIIDLHENHVGSLSRNKIEEWVFEKYRRWEFSHFKSLVRSTSSGISLTTVSAEIASEFEESVGVLPAVLRNSPALVRQEPSKVDGREIRLVHHGVGTNYRGIEESIKAMRDLPPKFNLTFYLVSTRVYITKVKIMALLLGVGSRVRFMKPVPTHKLATEINAYDLALVVIPPVTPNEEMAVPNKLLESIQGRLGLIVGPNSAMSKIVRDHKLGIVLGGWTSADIVDGLSKLSSEAVTLFKMNSHRVSGEYSSKIDNQIFLSIVEGHI
jgi:hypothetical protein